MFQGSAALGDECRGLGDWSLGFRGLGGLHLGE